MCRSSEVKGITQAGEHRHANLLVRTLRWLDDGNGAGSPQIMALALNTLRIQLIIFGMELERDVVLLLVGHHQIQILATSTPHEGGFAGIERQNIHTTRSMDERASSLVASHIPTFNLGDDD